MDRNHTNLVRPIDILLVEDSAGDRRLAAEAMKEGKFNNRLFEVEDGVEAMEFLRREGEYKDAPRPDLILLDLNLPRRDGREVLAEVKEDDELRRIPVVVLTTSDDEVDVLKSYELHANCYVTKPLDLGSFMEVVQSIEHFWLSIVVLPCDEQR